MINVLGAGYYPAKLTKNLFSEKGPRGQLNLHVMGHFVLHLVVGIDAGVLGEHGGEGDFGHAGKADEVPTGEDRDVRDERLKGFESAIVMMMSRDGEPDEVVRSVVKDVTVEMVTLLSVFGFAMEGGADQTADGDIIHLRIMGMAVGFAVVVPPNGPGALPTKDIEDVSLVIGKILPTFPDFAGASMKISTHSSLEFGCRRGTRE